VQVCFYSADQNYFGSCECGDLTSFMKGLRSSTGASKYPSVVNQSFATDTRRMGWTLTLRSAELEAFRRCPRAWDIGSRNRQNYVPIVPREVIDFGRAIRDALAVYYFPAMDDWNRMIVRPLALHAFRRKVKEHRASQEARRSLDAAEIALWTRYSAYGERLLERYFAWCATVDDFESVLSDHELRAPIPDPFVAGRDLVAPDGRALRYVSRLDQLIAEGDELWIVHHRLAEAGRTVEGSSTIGWAYRRLGSGDLSPAASHRRQHLQRAPRRRGAARRARRNPRRARPAQHDRRAPRESSR